MMSFRVLNMWLAAIVLASFVNESTQQDLSKLPEIEGYTLHCIEASGIKEVSAKKLSSGEKITDPDQATKCYIQCFFQKLRLMNESGEVQKDVLVRFLTKILDEDKAKTIAEKCQVRRTNPCDTAYAVFQCYQEDKAKLF